MVDEIIECNNMPRVVKKFYKQRYSSRGKCEFSRLQTFNYLKDMPFETLHCEAEGDLKRELCWFLQFGYEVRAWSYKKFLTALTQFRARYRHLTSFLPRSVSKEFISHYDNDPELNASKIEMLAFSLPYVLSSFISSSAAIRNSVQYKSFLSHLRQLKYELQCQFTLDDLNRYENLVKEHVQDLHAAYIYRKYDAKYNKGDFGAKPKTHYILHTPDIIRRFGPLRHYDPITVMRRLALTARKSKWSDLKRFHISANGVHDLQAYENDLMEQVRHEVGVVDIRGVSGVCNENGNYLCRIDARRQSGLVQIAKCRAGDPRSLE